MITVGKSLTRTKEKSKKGDYAFDILKKEITPTQIRSKVKIITLFNSQQIKVLSEQN